MTIKKKKKITPQICTKMPFITYVNAAYRRGRHSFLGFKHATYSHANCDDDDDDE